MSNLASESHFIGPMGSEFWQIQVSPEVVQHMAERKMDWRVLGRRVLIDTISGVITWISPSGPTCRPSRNNC